MGQAACECYCFEMGLLAWVRVFIRFGVLSLQALEKIATYMQSDRFLKMPVNNKMAQWGNRRIC